MKGTGAKKSDSDSKKSIEDTCRTAINKANQGATKEAKRMFDEARNSASKMEYEDQIQGLTAIRNAQNAAKFFFEANGTADLMKKLQKKHGLLPNRSPSIGILGLTGSGKTSFLVSILNFLESHGDFAIDYPTDEKFHEGEIYIRDEVFRWKQGLFPNPTAIGKGYLVAVDVYKRKDPKERVRLMIPDIAGENLIRVFNNLTDQGLLVSFLGPPRSMSSEEVDKVRSLIYEILEDCDRFLYVIDPRKDSIYQGVQNNVLYNIQRDIALIKTGNSANVQGKLPRFWTKKKSVRCAVAITKTDDPQYEYLEDNFEDWLRNNLALFISKVTEMVGDSSEDLTSFCFACAAVSNVDTKSSPHKITDPTPKNILEGPLSYFFGDFFTSVLRREEKKEDDVEEEKKMRRRRAKSETKGRRVLTPARKKNEK
jgi:hypothetical protein